MTENKAYSLKRPNLFGLKSILECLEDYHITEGYSMSTFNFLSESVEGVSNRRDLAAYLRLLCELTWITKKEQPSLDPESFASKAVYELTEKGKLFLSLFPKKDQEEETNS